MRSETTVEIVGSMDSGHGTCLMFKEERKSPIVVDCGASPSNILSARVATDKIVQAVVNAQPALLALTHFHFDHCGAVPKLLKAMDRIEAQPPMIVLTDFTFALMQRCVKSWPWVRSVQPTGIRMIPNKHSVPGSAGVLIQGKKTIFYTGDCYGIDLPDSFPEVDLLIIDSTGAMRENPREDKEVKIRNNIISLISETLLGNRSSKAYVALFSSQLERAAYLQDEVKRITCNFPRVKGLSLCLNLNAFRGNAWSGHKSRVALTTGIWAQGENSWLGEDASALVKISNGREEDCQLENGDLVVLSGSIPTWSAVLTRQIEAMCRRIRSLGARLVVNVSAPESWSEFAERKEIHSGGHGNMPEIAGLIGKIRPKMVLPFHASPEARAKVKKHCESQGISAVADDDLPLIKL